MPTENRSSNTEMVSVPRDLAESIIRMLQGSGGWKTAEQLGALLSQPAQQQGEPVAWLVTGTGMRGAYIKDPSHWAHGYSVRPLYTHADAGEVERLRYKAELYDEVWQLATGLGYMNVTTAICKLRDQLAERNALLRKCLMAVREQHCDDSEADFDLPAQLMAEIDAALSVDTEPRTKSVLPRAHDAMMFQRKP